MLQFIIIFLTSLVATTLSSMSGGGSSVITIPVLLWLGIPFPLAAATQRTSAIFWVLPASRNYLKGRKIDWIFVGLFAFIGLIGAYFGFQIILSISQRLIQIIIGILILILVLYTFLKKNIGFSEQRVYSKLRRSVAYIFALLLGFYESIFGSGNAIMFSILTFHTRGFDFIYALGYYYLIAFFWNIFAAGLFIFSGYFSFSIFLPVILGSLIGGYIGSRYAQYKGNRFIKVMFCIIGSVLGLKLLLGF